jgi:hypothetical protein
MPPQQLMHALDAVALPFGCERRSGPHHHGWGREAGAGRVQPPAAPPPCDAGTGPIRPARTAAPYVRCYHDQEQVNEDGHGGSLPGRCGTGRYGPGSCWPER